jgi:hypothetical protein
MVGIRHWGANKGRGVFRVRFGNDYLMERSVVVRNLSAQLPALYFGLIFILFFANSFQRNAPLGLTIPMMIFSFAFMLRSPFAGYLEVAHDVVSVRTMFRTRVFDRKLIETVEPVVAAQFTTRVFPVIKFRDGTSYKLSEFFSQNRRYKRRPESSIVTKAIEAFETV